MDTIIIGEENAHGGDYAEGEVASVTGSSGDTGVVGERDAECLDPSVSGHDSWCYRMRSGPPEVCLTGIFLLVYLRCCCRISSVADFALVASYRGPCRLAVHTRVLQMRDGSVLVCPSDRRVIR